jgi:hypothetical protein
VQLMKGGAKPAQGLRLNGEKKMQILRAFEDDEAGCYVVYGKKVRLESSPPIIWKLTINANCDILMSRVLYICIV